MKFLQNKNILVYKFWLISFCAVLLFAACEVTQPFKVTEVAPDNLYRDVQSKDTTSIAALSWKQVFTDTILQALIDEGLANNYDLKIAEYRIEEALANFKQSRLVVFPTLDANGQVNLEKKTYEADFSHTYQLSAQSNWEIDFWGKLRSGKRAMVMALKQSEAYSRTVRTGLISDIASLYFNLLALDQQLRITEQSIDIRKEDVESMKALKESNVVTGAAVVQSEANRYSAEVTLPEIRRNIRETENSLSILLGRAPGAINRSTLDVQNINMELKTGVPALLLANRPDVQQAEYQLRYNAELTNVARTYFYPSLSITAQAGYAGSNFSNLINSSAFFANIIGGLTQPIFNQGVNRQRLRVAKAQQAEALVAFKQSLLNAGREVSDALFAYQIATEKIELRLKQVSFLEKSVEYTKELLKYTSATNYTDVLTSEQGLLSAQLSSIDDKQQQLLSLIDLYRSLGGGVR